MRPTIDEQLAGTRRILEEVVLPDLRGDYPIAVLRSVIANLAMLERGWADVLPFLHWDNAAMAALLGDAAPAADDAADPFDHARADARNVALRQALSDLVAGADDALRARITAHLAERAARFPMRMSIAMPGAA